MDNLSKYHPKIVRRKRKGLKTRLIIHVDSLIVLKSNIDVMTDIIFQYSQVMTSLFNMMTCILIVPSLVYINAIFSPTNFINLTAALLASLT